MLEPKFKAADVKKLRQKRRSYITKVEILVFIITSVESEPVSLTITNEELDSKIAKLNKIENEEYQVYCKTIFGDIKRKAAA